MIVVVAWVVVVAKNEVADCFWLASSWISVCVIHVFAPLPLETAHLSGRCCVGGIG